MKNSPLQANVAEVVVDKPVKMAKNTLLEKKNVYLDPTLKQILELKEFSKQAFCNQN